MVVILMSSLISSLAALVDRARTPSLLQLAIFLNPKNQTCLSSLFSFFHAKMEKTSRQTVCLFHGESKPLLLSPAFVEPFLQSHCCFHYCPHQCNNSVESTYLDSLNYKINSITILSFVKQSDIEKINAYCEAKQITKNKRKFDFVETHCKALMTTIKGLGKISGMDCIVKICTNICCVITALFDVRPGNPVPLLYAICIKTIECIKHLNFIKWHNNAVNERVPQLPYIFYMLHKVLSQLASLSTNLVNNNLVELRDNGSELTITLVLKIVQFVTRFFSNMDSHVIKGLAPKSSQTSLLAMCIQNTKLQKLLHRSAIFLP